MTLKNLEMIAETRSYILRWRPRCRRFRLGLSSLLKRDNGCRENTANEIGRMSKNKQRAARAARTSEFFRAVLWRLARLLRQLKHNSSKSLIIYTYFNGQKACRTLEFYVENIE